MPDEDQTMNTAEHDQHDDFKEPKLDTSGGGGAAEQAKGALASSDGTTAAPGTSFAAESAAGEKASSADGVTDTGDAGVPVHEPQPPHTGSGPFPDPPQQ